MAAPIILWNPKFTKESDDAGNNIIKTTLPPPVRANPQYRAYDPGQSRALTRVPRLASFCIRALSQYPEQIYQLGAVRIHFDPEKGGTDDVLRAVLPKWKTRDFSLLDVDPRLWVTIVQVYSNPPTRLSCYPCQLSDPHVPLLNQIPCTADFALLTVLNLTGSSKVTDDNILSLKTLHNLSALDLTGCLYVSSRGIEALSRTLMFNELGEKRGPWALRILRMRRCFNVDRKIFDVLHTFPILTVVDLRETRCDARDIKRPFFSAFEYNIFELPLDEAVRHLSKTHRFMFSTEAPFVLYLQDNPLQPRTKQPNRTLDSLSAVPATSKHNSFVVLPPSRGSTFSGRPMSRAIQFGNVDTNEFLEKKATRETNERRTNREDYYGSSGETSYHDELGLCACWECCHMHDEGWDLEDDLDDDERWDSEDDLDDDEDSPVSTYESYEDEADESDTQLLYALRQSMRSVEETQSVPFPEVSVHPRPLPALEEQQTQQTGVQAASAETFYRQRPYTSRRPLLSRRDRRSYEMALFRMPPTWETLDSIIPNSERIQGKHESSTRRESNVEVSLIVKKKRKAPVQLLQAELSKRRKSIATTNVSDAPFKNARGLSPPPSPTSTVCDAREIPIKRRPALQPISDLRPPLRSSFSGPPRLKLDSVDKSIESPSSSRPPSCFSSVTRKSRDMSLVEGFKLQAQKPSLSAFTGASIKASMLKDSTSGWKSQKMTLSRGQGMKHRNMDKKAKSNGVGGFDWERWRKR